MSAHLLVALSAHGYGHFSQVAPVINQLLVRQPDLQLTFRTTLPVDVLRQRITHPFSVQPQADDFGMVMHNALDVDVAASVAAYREVHADWDARVAKVAEELRASGADLVLADVPYLTLAAARHAAIPSVALCSLNWADVLHSYLGSAMPPDILAVMRDAYASARRFLQPAPSMPMPALSSTNLQPIGPVCWPGQNRRAEVLARLGLSASVRLVLVGMGGMEFNVPVRGWPAHANNSPLHYLLPASWGAAGEGMCCIDAVGLPYSDILASVDVVITKPGYGMFVEAAAGGVPVLYVEREVWPDVPALEKWLGGLGHCRKISRAALAAGELQQPLQALLAAGRYQAVAPAGNAEAADCIHALLCELS